MKQFIIIYISIVYIVLFASSVLASSEIPAEMVNMLERVQTKMVKIHGAGGVRGLEAYQSGFLISSEGHVLTVWSYVLDTDYVTVTLDAGRKFEGKLAGAEPRLELAVLK